MSARVRHCDCEICKHHHEFTTPDDLLADFLAGTVTIFAGAGISSESRNVLKTTFYDSIADELELRQSSLSFPELMEKYCSQPNGRFKLLQKIKERFEHIDSFPELNRAATELHRELGTLFLVRNIITTNWDTYFEDHCRATPFVTGPDLAFWEAADRRVLKIHGSITNFGSIVATSSDYEKCREELKVGLIGGLLKTILATQTVLFVGYSLSDFDFLSIYEFVKAEMDSLHKQSYVVTPFKEESEKFKEAGLISITTDASYFIRQIKAHAMKQGLMLDDEIYDAALRLLEQVREEHDLLHRTIKASDHPELIYAASYQDGMIHALERAVEMRGTGQYSHQCRLRGSIKAYLEWQKKKLRNGVYEDVAYIEGYVNALTYLLLDREQREKIRVPFYYMFGVKSEIRSVKEYVAHLKRRPNAHKASINRAKRYLQRLSQPEPIEFHHPPWL